MKTYQVVGEVASKSNPMKKYRISEDENGNLSCNCPAWIFKNARESKLLRLVEDASARYCKHISEYLKAKGAL